MNFDDLRTKRPDLKNSEESKSPESEAAQLAPLQPEEPRTIAGRYKIVERLPAGRTGVVWKATDKKTEEFVAVREFSPFESQVLLKRFEKNLSELSRLSHPNIIGPCDSGVTNDNLPYVVTPLIGHPTLKQFLASEKSLPEPRCVEIFVQIAEALAHAHTIGIQHGDVVPNNIFVHEDDERRSQVIMTDFGIESLRESPLFDPQDDVFAFGALMYECLNGHSPVLDDSNMLTAPFRSHISPELQSIVLNCLNPIRKERYLDGSEILENLLAMKCQKLPSPPKNRPGQNLMTPKVLIPLVCSVVVVTGAICWLMPKQPNAPVQQVTPVTENTPVTQRPVVSTMKRTIPRRTLTGRPQGMPETAPLPLESLQQPIPLEPNSNLSSNSITKEKIKNAAEMGAVGSIAVYNALDENERQRAKDAAVSGLSKGLKKWRSLNESEKASVKRTAGNALGTAVKLWKHLPDR